MNSFDFLKSLVDSSVYAGEGGENNSFCNGNGEVDKSHQPFTQIGLNSSPYFCESNQVCAKNYGQIYRLPQPIENYQQGFVNNNFNNVHSYQVSEFNEMMANVNQVADELNSPPPLVIADNSSSSISFENERSSSLVEERVEDNDDDDEDDDDSEKEKKTKKDKRKRGRPRNADTKLKKQQQNRESARRYRENKKFKMIKLDQDIQSESELNEGLKNEINSLLKKIDTFREMVNNFTSNRF